MSVTLLTHFPSRWLAKACLPVLYDPAKKQNSRRQEGACIRETADSGLIILEHEVYPNTLMMRTPCTSAVVQWHPFPWVKITVTPIVAMGVIDVVLDVVLPTFIQSHSKGTPIVALKPMPESD